MREDEDVVDSDFDDEPAPKPELKVAKPAKPFGRRADTASVPSEAIRKTQVNVFASRKAPFQQSQARRTRSVALQLFYCVRRGMHQALLWSSL